MTTATLLDLIRPPNGYSTERAVWLTHDLDTLALTEHVLPALAGVAPPERGPRLASLAVLPKGVLTVAHATDRLTSVGFTSDLLVTRLPVGGRRQHAKLIVLRYRRDDQGVGPRVIWRTIVTSANLTPSGLRSNREAWVVDEIASNSRSPTKSYLPPSVDALLALASSRDVASRAALRAGTRALADKLPSRLVPASLTHSLDGPFPLLDALGSGPFRRLMLCAPTFTGRDRALVSRVTGLLADDAQVDIVVPLESPRAATLVPVPLGRVEGLQAAGHRVAVHASRLFDRAGHSRRLHGKQYIGVHQDGTATVIIGSPNLTERGLLGKNRELVLTFNHADGDQLISDVLDQLDTARPVTMVAAPDNDLLPPTAEGSPAPVFPFTPDKGSSPIGRIHGRLGKHRGAAKVSAVRVDGQVLHPPVKTWLSRESLVEAQVDGDWVPAVVHIRSSDERGFWASVERDDLPPQTDELLRQLLRDLNKARGSENNPPPTSADHTHDGRFDIPLLLWLNLVTRHRQRLPRTYPDLEAAVKSRLRTPAERRVASAVLRTQPDINVERDLAPSPLLDALSAHLRYLDRLEGSDDTAQ